MTFAPSRTSLATGMPYLAVLPGPCANTRINPLPCHEQATSPSGESESTPGTCSGGRLTAIPNPTPDVRTLLAMNNSRTGKKIRPATLPSSTLTGTSPPSILRPRSLKPSTGGTCETRAAVRRDSWSLSSSVISLPWRYFVERMACDLVLVSHRILSTPRDRRHRDIALDRPAVKTQ